MDIQVSRIMAEIVNKKGLIGTIAKLYLHDEQKARQFIRECGHQMHNPGARKHWGEELSREIELFCADEKQLR